MLIEKIRSRVVYKSLDAAMTASLRPRGGLGASVLALVSPRSSNYDRVASLVNALDGVVPGTARRVTGLICGEIHPPFPATHVELLAFGSGSTVFRVKTGSGDRVIKFYRRSLGVGAERLPAIVEWFRDKYETVSRWYADVPGVVWPAEFSVLDGPVLGRPAAVCIQSFIEGRMRDLVDGFADGELDALMARCEPLRDELVAFARRTEAVRRDERRCADLLGENNLTIVDGGVDRGEDRPRLHLIDYGLFDLDATDGRTRLARARLDARLDRLAAIAARFA